MADYDDDNNNGRYADEPRYERDRSASPRARSRSPNGRSDDRAPPMRKPLEEDEEGAVNTGSNLFVTGIHPRLTESDISRLFEKYGDVDNCSIMLDPHTKESRGFGFVNMSSAEQADAAKEGLQGEVIEGRTLSIEKARRSKPRTPTPGKYFGPPKREGRGPPRRGDRYDDRRGGMGGGNWRRREDDYYSGRRYDSYERRDYGRESGRGDYRSRDYGGRDYRRDSRDDYGYRGDRYSREDRRGGGAAAGGEEARGGFYERDANPASYEAAPPREPRDAYAGRSYEGRGEERYGSR